MFQDLTLLNSAGLDLFIQELEYHLSLDTNEFWAVSSKHIPLYQSYFVDYFSASMAIKPIIENPDFDYLPSTTTAQLRRIHEKIFLLFLRLVNGWIVPEPKNPSTSSVTRQRLAALTSMDDEESLAFNISDLLISAPLLKNTPSMTDTLNHCFTFENALDFVYLYGQDPQKELLTKIAISKLNIVFRAVYYKKFNFFLKDLVRQSYDYEIEYSIIVLKTLLNLDFDFIFHFGYYQADTGLLTAMLEGSSLKLFNQVIGRLSSIGGAQGLDLAKRLFQFIYSEPRNLQEWDKACLQQHASEIDITILSLVMEDASISRETLPCTPNNISSADKKSAVKMTIPCPQKHNSAGTVKSDKYTLESAMMSGDREALKQKILNSVKAVKPSTPVESGDEEAEEDTEYDFASIPSNTNVFPLRDAEDQELEGPSINEQPDNVPGSVTNGGASTRGASRKKPRSRGGLSKKYDNHNRKDKAARKQKI